PPPATAVSPLSLHDALPIFGQAYRLYCWTTSQRQAEPGCMAGDHYACFRPPHGVRYLGGPYRHPNQAFIPHAARCWITSLVTRQDRKSTRLNSSHVKISHAV